MKEFHLQWTVPVNTSAEELWSLVGNFGDFGWTEGQGHVVTDGEDAKVRTRVVQSPNGGQPVEFEERLLEEPDSREKPFVHAYSWSTHKHPFGEKMDDVVETIRVVEGEDGKTHMGWSISGQVQESTEPEIREHATACMVHLTKGLVDRFNK